VQLWIEIREFLLQQFNWKPVSIKFIDGKETVGAVVTEAIEVL